MASTSISGPPVKSLSKIESSTHFQSEHIQNTLTCYMLAGFFSIQLHAQVLYYRLLRWLRFIISLLLVLLLATLRSSPYILPAHNSTSPYIVRYPLFFFFFFIVNGCNTGGHCTWWLHNIQTRPMIPRVSCTANQFAESTCCRYHQHQQTERSIWNQNIGHELIDSI